MMVGGERRRVRKFVEVLQCRRCCGYGHGLYIARGASVVRGVGVHTKLRTAKVGIREHVWCVGGTVRGTWGIRPDQEGRVSECGRGQAEVGEEMRLKCDGLSGWRVSGGEKR